MLAMSDINCIKHLRNNKGLSITKIEKTLGINWRTAKKYADQDQLPKEKNNVKKGMMYEEKWGEIISDWLAEDCKLKRRLRRTKKQLFLGLKELGFKGSYRTVCYFISDWMNTHNNENVSGHERLEHPPGEAQVDFGVMEAVHDGELIDIHALVMSFPFSNAAFAVPLPAENQECLLYGLKQLFKQAGGVPRSIRIDNLTPAVKKTRTKLEEAQLTDEFIQFQNHYGFDVQVCNPRSGHEKGHVERKVGYIRYNFFSTAPIMESFDDLTTKLAIQLREDQKRLHYEKEVLIENLWQQEHKQLLYLPELDYPIFKEQLGRVNKYNELNLDKTLVHIPNASRYSLLHVIVTWDRFKVVSPDGELLFEDFRPYMNKRRAIPWLSIFKTWIAKPRVVTHSRYTKYLPGRVHNYLKVDDLLLRRERLMMMANLLITHDMKRINEEFYELIAEDKLSTQQDPYGVNWDSYDSLTPDAKGRWPHE
jgi:transposase